MLVALNYVTVSRVIEWNAPLSPWESLWECGAHGKNVEECKWKTKKKKKKAVIAHYSSFISEICNYQSGRAAILLLFMFSSFLCECVCVCFLSRLKISLTHTHTYCKFINRNLWSSAELQCIVFCGTYKTTAASRNLTTMTTSICPSPTTIKIHFLFLTFNNNLL